jgi:hypothetical protein
MAVPAPSRPEVRRDIVASLGVPEGFEIFTSLVVGNPAEPLAGQEGSEVPRRCRQVDLISTS